MMLDSKGAVKAKSLGLVVFLDPLAEALAAVRQFGAGLRAPRLGAAEKSETHRGLFPCSVGATVTAAPRYAKYRYSIAAITRGHCRGLAPLSPFRGAGAAANPESTRTGRCPWIPGARPFAVPRS